MAAGVPLARLLAAPLAAACWLGAATAAELEPLATQEIAPGLYVHVGAHEDFTPANQGGIANLVLVVGNEAAAVIDTGGSPAMGAAWQAAVRALTDLPIRYVIATHGHPDHLFGHAAFRGSGARFVGHARLPAALAGRGPTYAANMQRLGVASVAIPLVAPDLLVAPGSSLVLDLGGRELELRAWQTAHTDADLTVLDRRSGTLLAGDLVVVERLPVIDGSLTGWLEVMTALARLPAQRVVPGHGPASVPWPEAVGAQRRYLEDLAQRTRAVLARGVAMGDAVAAVPLTAGGWALAADNHPRNVIAAYKELEWE